MAKLSQKARAVKNYERNCPQSLKAYVTKTLKYESCADWDYESLADEFGFGFMIHWNDELEKLNLSMPLAGKTKPDENMHDLTRLTN